MDANQQRPVYQVKKVEIWYSYSYKHTTATTQSILVI